MGPLSLIYRYFEYQIIVGWYTIYILGNDNCELVINLKNIFLIILLAIPCIPCILLCLIINVVIQLCSFIITPINFCKIVYYGNTRQIVATNGVYNVQSY